MLYLLNKILSVFLYPIGVMVLSVQAVTLGFARRFGAKSSE